MRWQTKFHPSFVGDIEVTRIWWELADDRRRHVEESPAGSAWL